MKSVKAGLAALCLMTLSVAAIAQKDAAKSETEGKAGDLKSVVVGKEAPESIGVAAARTDAKDGAKVVVKGKVKDFVDGAAVMTIVDTAIKSCDEHPGDQCKTPWDYCCETKETLAKNSATVMVVGAEGMPVGESLQGVNGLDRLAVVVAEGTAKKDEAGNLVVETTKIYKP